MGSNWTKRSWKPTGYHDRRGRQGNPRAPRWRFIEARLALEDGTDPRLERALVTLGHQIEKLPFGDALFGAAAVAGLDLETGSLLAATDPRREVWAAGW